MTVDLLESVEMKMSAPASRIHNLLDKYDLKPRYSDTFGKKGREWLRNLQLPTIERTILDVNLKQLQSLKESVQALTVKIAQEAIDRPDVKLAMGSTGMDYTAPCEELLGPPFLKELYHRSLTPRWPTAEEYACMMQSSKIEDVADASGILKFLQANHPI